MTCNHSFDVSSLGTGRIVPFRNHHTRALDLLHPSQSTSRSFFQRSNSNLCNRYNRCTSSSYISNMLYSIDKNYKRFSNNEDLHIYYEASNPHSTGRHNYYRTELSLNTLSSKNARRFHKTEQNTNDDHHRHYTCSSNY
mmetsp:Transcript_21589/g.32676  ORF Transcript_21589/g.32676 Transcript_21589/m.32676 type:complete len:139 (+) Transcript_21589:469-885(+)